jgi:hypothetical protein
MMPAGNESTLQGSKRLDMSNTNNKTGIFDE